MRPFPGPTLSARAAATLTAAICAAALAWWLIGDLSYDGNAGEQGLDRMVQPPVSEATASSLGRVSAVLLPLVLVACWRLRGVLLPAVVLGAVVGTGGRVVTAGVIGANIGGGMILLISPLLLLALGGWLAVRWLGLDDRDRPGRTTSSTNS